MKSLHHPDLTAAKLASKMINAEVVRAGLRALQERDQAVERWLREEVVPAHDAMTADLARGLSAQAVFDDIRAHHAAAMKVPLANAREDLTP